VLTCLRAKIPRVIPPFGAKARVRTVILRELQTARTGYCVVRLLLSMQTGGESPQTQQNRQKREYRISNKEFRIMKSSLGGAGLFHCLPHKSKRVHPFHPFDILPLLVRYSIHLFIPNTYCPIDPFTDSPVHRLTHSAKPLPVKS
jgi:hypothetical protein